MNDRESLGQQIKAHRSTFIQKVPTLPSELDSELLFFSSSTGVNSSELANTTKNIIFIPYSY